MQIHRIHRRSGRSEEVREGFTLAELMVVIVIIGLLATLVVPNVISKLFKAQKGKATADIIAICGAIDAYALENQGRYPTSLEALVEPDQEHGIAYLDRNTVPKDPWGREYGYEPPAQGTITYRVFTYGQDGVPGGEGKDQDLDNIMIKNQQTEN